LRAARPFTCAQRIVDAHGRSRTLLVTGQGVRTEHGPEIVGQVADVTPLQREAVTREARRAVDGAMASAAVIEQARGVLMAVHGLTEEDALTRLTERAAATGADLRAVATQLVGGLSGSGGLGAPAARPCAPWGASSWAGCGGPAGRAPGRPVTWTRCSPRCPPRSARACTTPCSRAALPNPLDARARVRFVVARSVL